MEELPNRNCFGINSVIFLWAIVLGINYKSAIGGLWDYTCTLEITLTLLNCFHINFQQITLTLTLTLLLVFGITNVIQAPPRVLLTYFPDFQEPYS